MRACHRSTRFGLASLAFAFVVPCAACSRFGFDIRGDSGSTGERGGGEKRGDSASTAGDGRRTDQSFACTPSQHILHSGASGWPEVRSTGQSYAVAWLDSRDGKSDLYMARLDASGARLAGDVRLTSSGTAVDPCFAPTDKGYGFVWMDRRAGPWSVYFALLDSAGGKLTIDARVPSATNIAESPALVWNGTAFAAVWEDFRNGVSDQLFFARYDAAGSKVGAEIQLTNGSAWAEGASLVWAGDHYGLVWVTAKQIPLASLNSLGARIRADVTITSPAAAAYAPTLAWMGQGYGVAWLDRRSGKDELYFARLDASGNRLGQEVLVAPATPRGVGRSLALVWTGEHFGIAWELHRTGTLADITFLRLDPNGTPLSTEISIGNGASAYMPALAAGSGALGLAWASDRNGGELVFTVLCQSKLSPP